MRKFISIVFLSFIVEGCVSTPKNTELIVLSEHQQCLDEVRLKGGDAWAAGHPNVTGEYDCCPKPYNEYDKFRFCKLND